MTLRFNQDLYSKAAIIKAAYHFTDNYYVHLDKDTQYYIVDIRSKGTASEDSLQGTFENELLAQTTREEIFKQTHNLRELIMARAFATTVIEDAPVDNVQSESVDASGVFEDWFDEK